MKAVNTIRYHETCPGCGAARKYKKIKFFICPECNAALMDVKKLEDYDSQVCKKCGAQIQNAITRAKEGEEKNTRVFYSCRKCGRPEISVKGFPFFTCPKCEDEIIPISKLAETEVGCCPTCGTDLTQAKERALAWNEENN